MPAAVPADGPAHKSSRQPVHQRIRFLVEPGILTRVPPSGQVPSLAARAVPGATICATFQTSDSTTSELGINRAFDKGRQEIAHSCKIAELRSRLDSLPIRFIAYNYAETDDVAASRDRKAKHGRIQ